MKFLAISDLHIKDSSDYQYDLLVKLINDNIDSVDCFILLGDIFDLMAGNHPQYYKRYKNYFEVLENVLRKGKKIIYIEGNHDMHLYSLYERYFKLKGISIDNLTISRKRIYLDIKDQRYMFSHGDDIEIGNTGFKIYKKLISSSILDPVANFIMPYSVLEHVGKKASIKSKKRNYEIFSEEFESKIKDKYRQGIEESWLKKNFDVAICGHSHVCDEYKSPNGFDYINISTSGSKYYYFDSRDFEIKSF